MGREGPCFHCGIKRTPLWRGGPADKPVLCNACGSRWGKRGTLVDYIPKHGLTQSSKLNLPINEKPVMPVQDDINIKSISTAKTEEVQHGPSCSLDNTNNKPRSESQDSSICSCNQMGSPSDEVTGLPLGIEIPRKKRSVLRQYYLTSTGRLHRQLLQILQEQQSDGAPPAADEDLLFMPDNAMMTSNGTALGAMLLK